MRIALVINEKSGSSDPDQVRSCLEASGGSVEVFDLGDADRAGEAGADRIVVAGGDGSIGTVAAVAARAGVPLGVIPSGTANDFARAGELPEEQSDACHLAVTSERLQPHELGWIGEEERIPFVNAASVGLASVAARYAEHIKRATGPAAYALGALGSAAAARSMRCQASGDGEALLDARVWQVTISVSGAFGGGSNIERADPSDGRLDLTTLRAGSRLGLARYAWGLRTGSIASTLGASTCHARRFEITTPKSRHWNIDGEQHRLPANVIAWAEHDAFQLVVG